MEEWNSRKIAFEIYWPLAKLVYVIHKPIPSLSNYVNKNLEIEKTFPAKVTSVLKVDITTMAIVFTISIISINKIVQGWLMERIAYVLKITCLYLQQRNPSWFHSVLRVERTFCVYTGSSHNAIFGTGKKSH